VVEVKVPVHPGKTSKKDEVRMKKLALLFAISFVFAAQQLMAGSGSHLSKMDWEKQLSEAQQNNDYGMCHEVVIAAYRDKNESVLQKAAAICWPIGKNVQKLRSGWALMSVETVEDYLHFVGETVDVQGSGAE